jgi:hypothetical protein
MVIEMVMDIEPVNVSSEDGLGRGWFRAFVRNPGPETPAALNPSTGSLRAVEARVPPRRRESPARTMSSMHCGLS